MPLARYDAEVSSGVLRVDVEQRAVMQRLDLIGDELIRRRKWVAPSRSLFARWKNPGKNKDKVNGIKGLYLWGGVGRGKTLLCDLFFETVPFTDKTRLHFHRFMQQIHTDLGKLDGVENPIERIADEWASHSRLLLLDEIHVNDITDAMLLGGLLTALFNRGVTLITTSNVPPEDLYKDGLQRARFIPAIAQIRNNTHVQEMVGVTDYRLRLLKQESVYRISRFVNSVSDRNTQQWMQEYFDRIRTDFDAPSSSIEINSRQIPAVSHCADIGWFTFDTLCNTSRSTQDYIELASLFQTILISDIPVMDGTSDDSARRFVNMIDEFYDRHVKLIISAQERADKLYTGTRLAFEFKRAASRLFEMQTTEYLGSAHQS
ncbi:MAG: cell division protein ZapE [Granulosicoccus sp.]